MKLNFIRLGQKIFCRIKTNTLRTAIRALRCVELSDDHNAAIRILWEMSNIPLLTNKDKVGIIFDNIERKDLDLRLRHDILTRMINNNFFAEVILSLYDNRNEISYCLPPAWANFFQSHGFRISLISKLMWFQLQARFLVASFLRVLRLTTYSIQNHKLKPEPHYWVLENVPPEALSVQNWDENNNNFISFLSNMLKKDGTTGPVWITQINQLNSQYKSNIRSVSFPYPPLYNRKKTVVFLFSGLCICARACVDVIFGNYAMAILAADAVEAKFIQLLETERLPDWYLMTNSQIGSRSPWTIIAERRGVKSGMVFYSTNNKALKIRHNSSNVNFPGYQFMNWPHYFVWDKFQAKWIQSIVTGSPKIIQTGYIPILNKYHEIPIFTARSVAVFDMTIHRISRYATLGLSRAYYTEKNIRSFLFEIQEVLEKFNLNLIVKPKRWSTTNSKHYQNTLKILSEKNNVTVLDPSIGAHNVIKNTIATISIPYTSTGVVAALKEKPSVYFDPLNLLEYDADISHGLPLLQSKQALEEWVKNLANKSEPHNRGIEINK